MNDSDWLVNVLWLLLAAFLLLLNGFFVGAEFALVKIRLSQVDLMVDRGRPFAATARWLLKNLDAALSVCQLGITMASLGLGWIGEPAFARLLTPLFEAFGIGSEKVLHTVSFIIAFTVITALHITVGEQVPKRGRDGGFVASMKTLPVFSVLLQGTVEILEVAR